MKALRPLCRITRITRFLPKLRGVGIVRRPAHLLTSRLFRDPPYRIVDFDGNLKLDVDPRELLGSTLWFIPDHYERLERREFCAAIRPSCNVLDVGANIGIYTLLAAKRGARVFAIEADPENAKTLRHHLELNSLTSVVKVFDMAASDHEHRAGLRRNPNNCGGSTVIPGDSVQAKKIDSLGLPPIDLCKMDIEGSEAAAIRGMSETLTQSPSMRLLVEYNPLGDQKELDTLLRKHFAHIAIAGHKKELRGNPARYCNLWCWN